MTIKTSVLSKFTSMEDLENNNWIILDSLGDIYEIYGTAESRSFGYPNSHDQKIKSWCRKKQSY